MRAVAARTRICHSLRVSDPPVVRLLDPDALAAEDGVRVRFAITIPLDALRRGAELEVDVPRRLQCARCDGGGCDRCDRTGIVRAPDDDALRVVRVRVVSETGAAVEVRVPQPFGGDSAIRQLLLEVRGSEETAPSVRAIRPLASTALTTTRSGQMPANRVATMVALAVAAIAAIVTSFFMTR